MTIGKKLALTCGGLIAAAALLSVVAIDGLSSLNEKTHLIVVDPLPGMAQIGRVQSAFLSVRGDVWRHIASADAGEKAGCERDIARDRDEANQGLQDYEKTITTPEDRALFEKIQAAWTNYQDKIQGLVALSRDGKNAEAAGKYVAEAAPIKDALSAALQQEVDLNRSNGERLAAESQTTYHGALWSLGITLALCGLGGALTAFYMVRNVSGVLRQTASELKAGADQVASASGQITSSSQSLAQGASEQAASLEQTSASTEEINSMARKNSENSRSAAGLVTESEHKFSEATAMLDQMVVAMDEINASSDRISKIIKVIDEIAFQTNILALNAAVEAARAGEAGMGFAVVADEVRNLAQRSAQAAKDTAGLIEESIARSRGGKVKVNQVAEAIRAVTEDMGKVKVLVDEVSTGSEEQARGIDQISKGVTEMGRVTQTNAANAEESASAAAELSAQAEAVKDIIGKLNSLVHSGQEEAAAERGHAARRASGPAGSFASSLSALGGTTARKPLGGGQALEKARAGAGANPRDEFPLESEF
jgi:methyl-accepting chemotaxis protein/methyl-accepting chemotaxis protein-1 (serine sensor receptor)